MSLSRRLTLGQKVRETFYGQRGGRISFLETGVLPSFEMRKRAGPEFLKGFRDNRLFTPRKAFSLVEVVLAIGVVSFALLGIVALLSQGLLSVQNAETLQATSNIANQLRGQMQLLSFAAGGVDSIQNMAQTTSYYTTDGVPTNAAAAYYKATFTVSIISSSSSGAVPVDDANFMAGNAQNVQVTLTYPPVAWNKTKLFSFLVARQTDN